MRRIATYLNYTELSGHESRILEPDQDREVEGHGQCDTNRTALAIAADRQPKTERIIRQYQNQQQGDEYRLPPCIKEKTPQEQHKIARGTDAIQNQKDRQKIEQECDRTKAHRPLPSAHDQDRRWTHQAKRASV